MELLAALVLVTLVVAAVFAPMLLRQRRAAAPGGGAQAALDRELEPYRAALRAGTLCERCAWPNPAGSRYCAECGRPLAESRTGDAPE